MIETPTLTVRQRTAHDARSTNVALKASAGCGKTTVITERLLAELERGTPLGRIVAVTFTEKAAANCAIAFARRVAPVWKVPPTSRNGAASFANWRPRRSRRFIPFAPTSSAATRSSLASNPALKSSTPPSRDLARRGDSIIPPPQTCRRRRRSHPARDRLRSRRSPRSPDDARIATLSRRPPLLERTRSRRNRRRLEGHPRNRCAPLLTRSRLRSRRTAATPLGRIRMHRHK